MNQYEVIITPDAEADLNELDDYITFQLSAPSTATTYIREIILKNSMKSIFRTLFIRKEISPEF